MRRNKMESMLNTAAWFVAIPTTGILVVVVLQVVIVLTSKGAEATFHPFKLISLCLIAGLCWGWTDADILFKPLRGRK
jgi:hypothetical protein